MVIKLSGVQFGLTHYFLTSIFKSPKYSTWSVQIFIDAVQSQSEIKFIHFFFPHKSPLSKISRFQTILTKNA